MHNILDLASQKGQTAEVRKEIAVVIGLSDHR